MMKHSYDKEFKEQAVQYYLDNKDHMTMNEISKNLGIGASTLHKWIKLFTETGEFGRGSGNFASDKDKERSKYGRLQEITWTNLWRKLSRKISIGVCQLRYLSGREFKYQLIWISLWLLNSSMAWPL